MYSKALEKLVQSAIADGQITDKERAVLHKRAAEEWVEEKDIDTYVNRHIASLPVSASTMGLSALERVEKDYNIYYRMKHPFELIVDEDSPMSRWYVNFIYIEKSTTMYPWIKFDGYNCNGWIGVQFYGFLKEGLKGGNNKSITIEIENKKIRITTQLHTFLDKSEDIGSWMSGFPISGIEYPLIGGAEPDFGDEGKLELKDLQDLCNATSFRFSYEDFCFKGGDKHHGAIVARPIYDFAAFAQMFYHAALDVTAYPDAVNRMKYSIEQERQRKEEAKRKTAEEVEQRRAAKEALLIARQEEWDNATTSGKIWLMSKRLWKEFIVIHWKGILVSLFILYCMKGCYNLMV